MLRFSAETIRALIAIHPEICFRWLRLLSRRLDRAYQRIVELAGRSSLERIVHFLSHEVEDRRSLTIEITQSDLADALALSRQTVSRVLVLLAREGVIERGRRRILIRDTARLRSYLPGERRTVGSLRTAGESEEDASAI